MLSPSELLGLYTIYLNNYLTKGVEGGGHSQLGPVLFVVVAAKEGARLTMKVEFSENNSGTSKKMRYFQCNKVGGLPLGLTDLAKK